jgi:formylglycine-generating enzyme required for sulfatase activity
MHMTVPPAAGAARWLVAAVAAAVLVVGLGIAGVVFFVKRSARSPVSVASAAAGSASAAITPDGGPRATAAGGSASAVPSPAVPSPADCPEGMALVTGGRYFMGSDDDLADEKPAHNVTLRAFCMDKYEVSADAYRACSDRGDCKRAGTSNKFEGITPKDQKTYDPLCNISAPDRGKHPINCVDWSMADRFCRAAGKRLPTEAEWEFAARGSDGRKFPWGDTKPTSKHLNACGKECVSWLKKHGAQDDGFLYPDDDGFPTTAPIGSFPMGASRWGIEDVVGNVWEWVADWYGAYAADDQADPKGPDAGKERVIRGGAWNGAYPDWVRPTFRFRSNPETRSHGIGFRCAKAL